MMKRNKYIIELIIDTANDNPDSLTKEIGLQPTKILKKGEPVLHLKDKTPIPGRIQESNLWIYKLKKMGEKDGFYLDNVISELLAGFDNSSEKLKEVLKKYPINRLNCVTYFNENNPFFQLDTALIEKLNDYSLKLTFDLYLISDN